MPHFGGSNNVNEGVQLNGPGLHIPQLKRSSSSFLGTLTNYVTAPLKWLHGSPENSTEGPEKRPLAVANGSTENLLSDERKSKRPRLHSPPREVARQQPSSSRNQWPMNASGAAYPRAYSQPINGHAPMPSPLPSSLNRVNTAIFNSNQQGNSSQRKRSGSGRNMSLDPALPMISRDSSMHLLEHSPQRSVSREVSYSACPPSPYRIRSSLTPQPHSMSTSPVRREFSVPRSSLMWPAGSPRSSLSPVREARREVRQN